MQYAGLGLFAIRLIELVGAILGAFSLWKYRELGPILKRPGMIFTALAFWILCSIGASIGDGKHEHQPHFWFLYYAGDLTLTAMVLYYDYYLLFTVRKSKGASSEIV